MIDTLITTQANVNLSCFNLPYRQFPIPTKSKMLHTSFKHDRGALKLREIKENPLSIYDIFKQF